MKKSSKELFDLIKSLEMSEKRYFKVFAARHTIGEKNNYVKLFDVLDAAHTYDEQQLIKAYPDEPFGKDLPYYKHYLYQTLLKSLAAFHSNTTIELEIKQLLHYVNILYTKALYNHAQKELNKAKKLAKESDKNYLLMEVLEWELRLIKAQWAQGVSQKEFLNLITEQEKTLGLIHTDKQYAWLDDKINLEMVKMGQRNIKDIYKKYSKEVEELLFSKKISLSSFESKRIYYLNLAQYYYFQDDFANSYNYLTKYVALLEPVLKLNARYHDPNLLMAFRNGLANLAICTLHLNKFEECQLYIAKLRELPFRSELIRIKTFSKIYSLEIKLYSKTAQYEKIRSLIAEFESNEITDFAKRISKTEQLTFYFYFANACYILNDFEQSIKWLNRIINDPDVQAAPDYHAFARILQLLLHYEMQNFEIVPYLIRSTYRFLSKRDSLYKIESTVLKYLKKIQYLKTNKDIIASLEDLKQTLAPIMQDPYEKGALDYFDFMAWLDSKIKNQPLAEVIRQKAANSE